MGSFLAGLGIGLGLGVVLAPMSGQELRETISDRATEVADVVRKKYDRAQEVATSAVESARAGGQQKLAQRATRGVQEPCKVSALRRTHRPKRNSVTVTQIGRTIITCHRVAQGYHKALHFAAIISPRSLFRLE